MEWLACCADEGPRGLHWETCPFIEYAMDRLWVDISNPPSLLHRIDPAIGLVDVDFSALADWLRSVASR